MNNKTQQNPINSYSEFFELKDGTKVEIKAESFEDPIFKTGDVMKSQILTINTKNKSLISAAYSEHLLTQGELQTNVKELKQANEKATNIHELYKLYGK